MPGSHFDVRVRGAEEVAAAFEQVRRETLRELRPALREIGKKVAKDAQALAAGEITNIGPRWQRMRVGVVRSGVYIAPASRRRGGSPRRNLAQLLGSRAMRPAVDADKEEVEAAFLAIVEKSKLTAGF